MTNTALTETAMGWAARVISFELQHNGPQPSPISPEWIVSKPNGLGMKPKPFGLLCGSSDGLEHQFLRIRLALKIKEPRRRVELYWRALQRADPADDIIRGPAWVWIQWSNEPGFMMGRLSREMRDSCSHHWGGRSFWDADVQRDDDVHGSASTSEIVRRFGAL